MLWAECFPANPALVAIGTLLASLFVIASPSWAGWGPGYTGSSDFGADAFDAACDSMVHAVPTAVDCQPVGFTGFDSQGRPLTDTVVGVQNPGSHFIAPGHATNDTCDSDQINTMNGCDDPNEVDQ